MLGGAPERPPLTPFLLAEYLCHVYVRSDGLAGVVIADNEYPQRVCFTLLDKVSGAAGGNLGARVGIWGLGGAGGNLGAQLCLARRCWRSSAGR